MARNPRDTSAPRGTRRRRRSLHPALCLRPRRWLGPASPAPATSSASSARTCCGALEHGGRRIDDCHVVTGSGEWHALVSSPAPDVDHTLRCGFQVLSEMLVDDMGANATTQRAVVVIDEAYCERSPRILGSSIRQCGPSCRTREGFARSRRRVAASVKYGYGWPVGVVQWAT